MRRLMLLLSLIAAFAGTPLRLAEAAEDLAHILAELVDDGGIESTDGGVGDDSGVTLQPDITHVPVASGLADAAPTAFLLAECPPGLAPRPSADPPAPTPPTSRRHCALLQRFLC